MTAGSRPFRRPGLSGAAIRLIDGWALLGGAVLIAAILFNVASVLLAMVWKPLPGDFELTEIGVAVAAFCFLPYCQIHNLNVTADIFTSRASPRWIAVFRLMAAVVALLFAMLMLWRMSLGMIDTRAYKYTTAILQVPLWWGYLPILVSLALLGLASAMTLLDAAGRIVRGSVAE
jgi:TRAP-type C4-dicarboxylate transport system permease small subunit